MNRPKPNREPHTTLKKGQFSRAIKRIILTSRRFWPLMLIAVVLAIAYVVIAILAPQYLKDLTDTITSNNSLTSGIDMKEVARLGGILIGLYTTSALLTYASTYLMTTVSQRYSQDLRKQIATKINRLPLAYFDSHSYGDILSRLTNDVDQIGQSLQQSVAMVIQSTLLLLGVLIAMFITSWQMTLAVLLSLPIMALFMIFIIKLAQPHFNRRQKELGAIEGAVEENYSGQLVVKCFSAEERVAKEFNQENKQLCDAMFKAEICGGLMMPINSFISYFAYIAVFVTGGILLGNGAAGITMGTISSFTIYVQLFQSPLTQIAQAFDSLQMAAASGTRIFEFLDEKNIPEEKDKTLKLIGPEGQLAIRGSISFEHVKFSYDSSRVIIPDFSAEIKPGMKVAIVGPTGAGKTT
ncbi:MAG TPA: ABC transporter, partial [Firmicutes bacterium]|nr:ABC transporter [Bacillota bacterium]